jgi:hypothetical protein
MVYDQGNPPENLEVRMEEGVNEDEKKLPRR